MPLETLPEELVDLCLDEIDMASLRACRLVNHDLARHATKRLFSHVTVYPTEPSAQKARSVLEDASLNPMVKKITLRTAPDPVPNPYAHDSPGEAELPEAYEVLVGDIGRFRGLRAVELKYSNECSNSDDNEVWETVEYRSTILKMLMESLNDEEHPASQVHDLKIDNLQDVVDVSVAMSEDFRAVLSRLDSLSLQIATEYIEAAPESGLWLPDPYRSFGRDLRQYWLEPVCKRLTHLKLYTRQLYWGYLPFCNLQGLHFPKLKSLSLGNMSITHDWQIDWIISHGSTLESLTLDDCPIVHAAKLYMGTRNDRYPNVSPGEVPKEVFGLGESTWHYEARWHSHLRRLKNGLPHLKHFGFGHGSWSDGHAFEETADLPATLYEQRYCIFDEGTGPSAWIEPTATYRRREDGLVEVDQLGYDCCWEEHPEYPDCGREDQLALDELLEAVRGRQ